MSNQTALAVATGTPATVGPAVPAATEAPKDLDSTRFARLAKQEAEIVKGRDENKRARAELEAERGKLKPIYDQYENYKKTKETDPVAALKLMGFTETDIINYLAAHDKPEPTTEEKAAASAKEAAALAIKEFQDAQVQKEEQAQVAKDTQIIKGYKAELSKAIYTNPEKFEYCRHHGPAAELLAYEFALAVVKESNGEDVVSAKEAIEMVEEYYEEQDKAMSTIKKRLPKPEVPVQREDIRTSKVSPGFPNSEQPKPTVTRSRTLTNAATASVASTRQLRNESREDKRERLINMLKGKG